MKKMRVCASWSISNFNQSRKKMMEHYLYTRSVKWCHTSVVQILPAFLRTPQWNVSVSTNIVYLSYATRESGVILILPRNLAKQQRWWKSCLPSTISCPPLLSRYFVGSLSLCRRLIKFILCSVPCPRLIALFVDACSVFHQNWSKFCE